MSGDGVWKRRQADRQADKARITRLQHALNFINPSTEIESTEDTYTRWYGIESVFGQALQGGQGRVCMWVRIDKQHRIVERMVIKDTNPPKKAWEGEDLWLPDSNRTIPREAGIAALFGNPTDEQVISVLRCLRGIHPVDPSSSQTSRTQDEVDEERVRHKKEQVEAQGIVDLLPNNAQATPSNAIAHDNGITKLLSYGVYPEKMTYRLYMEYLPHYNLEVLIGKYWDNPPSRPPEPFLWYLLYRLMIACKNMEDVVQLRGGQTGSIIHQDIKYANVFLGDVDTDNNELWPLPKIGDFGSARITYQLCRGPWDPIHTLTDKIQPPEYRAKQGLTTAVNVWQSAYIIRGLMQLTFPWFDLENEDVPGMDDTEMYSTELRQVVRGCLAQYPQNRYRPQAVLDYIRNNQDRFIRGLVDGSNTPDPATTQELLINYRGDLYREGFTYNPPHP